LPVLSLPGALTGELNGKDFTFFGRKLNMNQFKSAEPDLYMVSNEFQRYKL